MSFLSNLFQIPGLSSYSDAEYERLVGQAKLRRGDAIWILPGLAGVLVAGAWIGVGVAIVVAMKSARTSPTGMSLRVLGLANILVAILLGTAVAMLVRWVLLVRSIRRIVNRAGCPFCEFSLVGLRVNHGWVQCPECGQRVYLFEHRMTPEDLYTRRPA